MNARRTIHSFKIIFSRHCFFRERMISSLSRLLQLQVTLNRIEHRKFQWIKFRSHLSMIILLSLQKQIKYHQILLCLHLMIKGLRIKFPAQMVSLLLAKHNWVEVPKPIHRRKKVLNLMTKRWIKENGPWRCLQEKRQFQAQLPIDMRPVLASSRHNKIPISVRQTQLYRLTEHFLRKVNLPEIRKTAETELAVADAINIEKEVADKSNSKIVYLNLCSQEIMHLSDNSKSNRATASNSSPSTGTVDRSEQAIDELPTDPAVIDALRNAGLLSDSPPSSPHHKMEVSNEVDDSSMQIKEEGPDNVFEIVSHPDVDIYGDFEYDLEDEDYIGATTLTVPKLPVEEGESRMKVVFSTLKSEMLNNVQDLEGCLTSGNNEPPKDSASSPKIHVDTDVISTTVEGGTNRSCADPESLPGEEGEEPSLAECDELYGPDKEPLINKFAEEASSNLYELADPEASTEHKGSGENENNSSRQDGNTNATSAGHTCDGETSCDHSQTAESGPKKDSSKTNTNKQVDIINSVSKKVEAYITEHIRPLCKSGIITAEQYRWAVAKTTDKVMKYHLNAKNANFLIKEGEKVKKLAEQYVEAAQQKEKSDSV